MKRGDIPYYQNDDDTEEWNDNGQRPYFSNFRNERYNNAYGDYKGGYGPMNNSGFRPMNSGGFGFGPRNSGGFGPRNSGNFGPMNSSGFRPMNSNNFGSPRFMGPPQGNFNPGIKSLFAPVEPFSMGRGFGPSGPPKIKKANDNKAFKYLLRCGVPREHIRNVPAAALQLMEPEKCGVCGLQFNSDAVARTHYLSKNHQKNQKKWLSQHSDGGLQQSKEIPFKSRELYCELCDVHITSKSHADSHYAGKTHRAIVEGRKLPRNPLLIQRGMASRLDQLIRREKRNLKAIDDTEEKEETVKEPKPFQPELYCKICKTCVTCTDQLTMHLNGKRHLSKEKQHILKMMKGESKDGDKEKENEDGDEDDEEASGNEGEKTEGDEIEATKDEGNEKGGDDYDWGNGSGTWDEPETC